MRSKAQSYLNLLLIFTTIFMSLVALHFFQKDQQRQHDEQIIRPEIIDSSNDDHVREQQPGFSPIAVPQRLIHFCFSFSVETNAKSKKSADPLIYYASDAHLRSLLRKQANPLKQVVVTIIGGDSYSLFAWDWHERMLEVSNTTGNCNCFVIAMDDIALVFAIQQKVPVYYMTFTFEQQMKWINVIESRQHSLYRVGYAKFGITAKIIGMGYSVMLTEMDVFWFVSLVSPTPSFPSFLRLGDGIPWIISAMPRTVMICRSAIITVLIHGSTSVCSTSSRHRRRSNISTMLQNFGCATAKVVICPINVFSMRC